MKFETKPELLTKYNMENAGGQYCMLEKICINLNEVLCGINCKYFIASYMFKQKSNGFYKTVSKQDLDSN